MLAVSERLEADAALRRERRKHGDRGAEALPFGRLAPLYRTALSSTAAARVTNAIHATENTTVLALKRPIQLKWMEAWATRAFR